MAIDIETTVALLQSKVDTLLGQVKRLKSVIFGENGGWRGIGLVQQVQQNQEALLRLERRMEEMEVRLNKRDKIMIALLIILVIQGVTGWTLQEALGFALRILGLW